MQSPLEGLRVLELGSAIAGPLCCRLMADLGAHVIKVEAPGGDPARGWGPRGEDGSSLVFHALNKEKRSLLVDFGDAAQLAGLKSLISGEIDIVVQNLRPGVAEAAGLGARQLAEMKPSLIVCDISAFGSTGPLEDRPGYEALLHLVQPRNAAVNIDAFPVKLPAYAGQLKHTPATLDQFGIELRLKTLQSQTDRRLTQQKPGRRRRNAAFFHDHHKGSQKVPVKIGNEFLRPLAPHRIP